METCAKIRQVFAKSTILRSAIFLHHRAAVTSKTQITPKLESMILRDVGDQVSGAVLIQPIIAQRVN